MLIECFPGDITLICADNRIAAPFIPTRKVALVLTDPPYGLLLAGPTNRVTSSDMSNNDINSVAHGIRWLCAMSAAWLMADGVLACFAGGDSAFIDWSIVMRQRLRLASVVVWNKGSATGWRYKRAYEIILIGANGLGMRWFDVSNRVLNVINPGDHDVRKPRRDKNSHPSSKPINLMRLFMRLHTLPGELIVDPFMGSGATAVAAVREKRSYIGVELEERWFNAACDAVALAIAHPEKHTVAPSLLVSPDHLESGMFSHTESLQLPDKTDEPAQPPSPHEPSDLEKLSLRVPVHRWL